MATLDGVHATFRHRVGHCTLVGVEHEGLGAAMLGQHLTVDQISRVLLFFPRPTKFSHPLLCLTTLQTLESEMQAVQGCLGRLEVLEFLGRMLAEVVCNDLVEHLLGEVAFVPRIARNLLVRDVLGFGD